MRKLIDGKISDLLIRYGVYNQTAIDAFHLDLELNIREANELIAILNSLKKIYGNREKMGKFLQVSILELKEEKKKFLEMSK